MNILQLSNYFNLIAQQSGFLMYHYGYESDVQRSVQNNFNPAQSAGKMFPAVIWEKPTQTLVLDNTRVRSDVNVRLNFFALQHYTNGGAPDFTQTIEQENALRIKVLDFLKMVHEVGKLQHFNVQTITYNVEYLEAQTPDRLIQIVVSFVVSFNETCPAVAFNPALVVAPYSYPPPDDSDFEKLDVDITAPAP